MIRDPVYRAIIQGLEGKLDPDVFESCAADILRDVYPGLTPIPGGQDFGMDGAIADGEGEAFPLAVTTQKNVIGNFTKSLNSYVTRGGKRRKVVSATSQELTPLRVRNLHDSANELGFTLINVHQREDIANRLYRHPEWTKELLGITGTPPALSIFPKSDRPLLNTLLVGRELDMQWLQETSGDRLIIGEPGSGKTYLLYEFAKNNDGLFVVFDDLAEIANGIRSQQPRVLIVDDAQIQLERIRDLKQMRQELGAEFSIVASCWLGDKDDVSQVLAVPTSHIHKIELLTRDDVVKVIKDVGLGGPTELIREIVNQAEGRPGLAVTLADLCLKGSVREVLLGDVIGRSVRSYFEPKIGAQAVDTLAAFSVGGDAGMSLRHVADALGMEVVKIRRTAVELAAGGVIWDVGDDRLSVHPAVLRHTFIRDVFFQGAFSLDIQPFIDHSPNLEETAHTLLGSYARDAQIDEAFLQGILEQVDSVSVWEEYAWRGQKEATYVLKNHPDVFPYITKPALERIPERVLPMLFQQAINDSRSLQASLEHPIRSISDWTKSSIPGSGIGVRRRELLLQAANKWMDTGGDASVYVKLVEIVFSPEFSDITADPGSGRTITWGEGFLSLEEMRELKNLWPQTFEKITNLEEVSWDQLNGMAGAWAYPGRASAQVSDEKCSFMKDFASEMITDIVSLAPDSPGAARWANQIAVHAELPIEFPVDEEFIVLYPIIDRGITWSEFTVTHSPKVEKLAAEWSIRNPTEIANRIVWLEEEGRHVNWPNLIPDLCRAIAVRVQSPVAWARALIIVRCQPGVVYPFLVRAIDIDETDWQNLVSECLDDNLLNQSAIRLVLKTESSPQELLDKAIKVLIHDPNFSDEFHLPGPMPEATLTQLLQHENLDLSTAAAKSEWYSQSRGQIRDGVLKEWREAVVRSRDNHFVADVLQLMPDIASDWLIRFLEDEIVNPLRFEESIRGACACLDTVSREAMMKHVSPHFKYRYLIGLLVGKDVQVYQSLLSDPNLEIFHLDPLAWDEQSQDVWIEMAKLALEKGYSPEEVARATRYSGEAGVSWQGHFSEAEKKWVEMFEKLLASDDDRIRKIGEIGRQHAMENLQEELQRERRRAIYGSRFG